MLKPILLESDKEIKLSCLFNEQNVIKLIKDFFVKNKGLKINGVDKKTLYIILSRTFHNNPLFIIELFDSLYDQKQIKIDEHRIIVSSSSFRKSCELMDWEVINIPFIIEKVVGNIIDSLKCEDIITLKHASVIGTIFDLEKLYKLNIINSLNFEGLKQKIYKFAEYGLVEILYDLDPKKIIVQFAIPFLKEVLYKRMLVETKNEIHLKVARLMGDSKFSYLKRNIEKQLINYHLIEEDKTILDHLVDTGDDTEEQILKEANQRIKYLKETIDTVKDIDTRAQDYNEPELYKQLSLDENNMGNDDE
jgi:predicted ATPase